jgi:hypothetical protein
LLCFEMSLRVVTVREGRSVVWHLRETTFERTTFAQSGPLLATYPDLT